MLVCDGAVLDTLCCLSIWSGLQSTHRRVKIHLDPKFYCWCQGGERAVKAVSASAVLWLRTEWSWWCVVAKISFCTGSFLVVLVIHQASGLFKCWNFPQRTAVSICRKVHRVKCNSSILELRCLRCSQECCIFCCGTLWSVRSVPEVCSHRRLQVGLGHTSSAAIRVPSQLRASSMQLVCLVLGAGSDKPRGKGNSGQKDAWSGAGKVSFCYMWRRPILMTKTRFIYLFLTLLGVFWVDQSLD